MISSFSKLKGKNVTQRLEKVVQENNNLFKGSIDVQQKVNFQLFKVLIPFGTVLTVSVINIYFIQKTEGGCGGKLNI